MVGSTLYPGLNASPKIIFHYTRINVTK